MKHKSLIIMSSIILWIFIFFTSAVLAEGVDLEVFLDGEEVFEGEEVTIVIRYRSEEEMGSIDAEISYDQEALEYLYGGGNIGYLSDGHGGITDIIPMGSENRTYYLTFRAIQAGEGSLSIDFSEVLSHETGESLGRPRASLTFSIQSREEEPPEDENGTTPLPDPVAPPDLEENFLEWEYEGRAYYLYRDGSEGTLPPGFSYETIVFDGEEITGAGHDRSDLQLIYAIPEQGGSQWYIYHGEQGTLYPYREIRSEQEYILLDIDEIIKDFTLKTIEIEGHTVDVLTTENFPEGVYLVYALDRRGAPHYYFYDENQGTFQRAIFTRGEVIEYIEIEGERDERGFPMWTIYSVGALIIVLLLSMIGVHYNRKKEPPSRRRRRGINNDTERGVDHE